MGIIRNLPVKYIQGLFSLIILCGFSIYLIFNYIAAVENRNNFDAIRTQNFPILESINKNWLVLLEIEKSFGEAILEGDKELLNQAREQGKIIESSFEHMNKLNPEISNWILPIHSAFSQYFTNADSLAKAMIQGSVDRKKVQQQLQKMHEQYNNFKAMQKSFKDNMHIQFINKLQESQHRAEFSIQFGLLVGTALTLVLVLTSVAINALITNPLNQATAMATHIAEGNWDVDMTEQTMGDQNEMGKLNRALHYMKNQLQTNFKDLEYARDQALMAERAKAEFLACMSHEIRTPMNGVLGMLNLLLRGELPEKQRHYATKAHFSAESLLLLINDILDFSKIEAGRLDLETIDFDLREQLNEFSEAMALHAQNKGLEFVLDTTQIQHSMVRGDPSRLRQILTNLVGNAIKFTDSGEIVVRADLKDISSSEFILHCSVTDTGIGIPADKLESLFGTFTQVDASVTRQFGGTGLGLSIAKQLCKLMGGDISVHSTLGSGSQFEFTLILQNSELSLPVMPVADIRDTRILVVDDNATSREVLCGQLTLWGAKVTEAIDGPSALALLEKTADTPFAVAILDMQMPNMDGATLGKAIRADHHFDSTQMIMMTSASEKGDAQYFAGLGFSAYFAKPATTSDLFDALAVLTHTNNILNTTEPLITHNQLQSLTDNSLPCKTPINAIQTTDARILLVDDNQINLEVAQGILEDIGLKADVAYNGLEAIAALNATADAAPYQLILMDCQMPEMDGYEATRQIRLNRGGSQHSAIPIIAMTANAMKSDRGKCLTAGMSDYLTKPIDDVVLEEKLCQWLKKSSTDKSGAYLEMPIWDKGTALKRVRGREDRLATLKQMLLRDMPGQIKKLQQTINQERIHETEDLAHAIKGSVGNLSGLRMHQLAGELEAAAKAGDADKLKDLWPLIDEQYLQLEVCLKQDLPGAPPPSMGQAP